MSNSLNTSVLYCPRDLDAMRSAHFKHLGFTESVILMNNLADLHAATSMQKPQALSMRAES